jgi:hypothetical protein
LAESVAALFDEQGEKLSGIGDYSSQGNWQGRQAPALLIGAGHLVFPLVRPGPIASRPLITSRYDAYSLETHGTIILSHDSQALNLSGERWPRAVGQGIGFLK